MSTLTRQEVNGLCECILNGIAGGAKDRLDAQCVKQCSRHRRQLRTLAFNHRLSWKKRRDILHSQSGSGWFIPLLGAVLSAVLATK